MQTKYMKRIVYVCVIALATIALSILADANEGKASEAASSECVYENMYAGAAKVLDVNTTPSTEEIEEIAKNNAWKAQGAVVMANVDSQVNVRLEPNEESDRVGYLYSDCGGYIVEYTDEWTKIQSGNIVGWVNNDYLSFGDEAMAKADELGCNRATICAETVRVRKDSSTESEVLGLVANGEVLNLVEETDEWLIVEYEGESGYISKEYATVDFKIDAGETVEEVAAREAAEKEAIAKAEAKKAELNQNYGAYASEASDVVLLGALIQCEAGNQPYEGKLAVGAVVLNRVRSSAYPNTVYGVIYASGQFSPAGSGAVDRRIANGVSESCLQAAQEALSGVSNVGDAKHFRPTGRHDGIVIAGHVFW